MKKRFINNYFVILSLIILFHVSNNIYFLNQDTSPSMWDTNLRQEFSLRNYEQLKDGKLSGLINQYIFFYDPPLSTYPAFFLYFLFGTSQDIFSLQGTMFLVILIIATYLLGKELFNKDVGLLAVVLLSFSPYILAISKMPFEDITFVAMFTLTLYFFVKSDRFSNIKYIWLFNISLGLTQLSKFSAVIVIALISITYILIKVLFDRKDLKVFFKKWSKRNIIHFVISFLISILVPIIYYSSSWLRRVTDIYMVFNIHDIHPNIVSITLNYLNTFGLNFEHISILILFIISFIFFLIYSKNKKLLIISLIVGANIYHMLLLFVLPIFIFDIPRYLLFINPLAFVIISLFLVDYSHPAISKLFKKINKKWIRKETYVYLFILLLIIVLVPFTLIINYTPIISKFSDYQPYGLYKPLQVSFDSKGIVDDLVNDSNRNSSILIFSPMNDFIIAFNSYALHNYDNVEVLNAFFYEGHEENYFEFRSGFIQPLRDYQLIKNNTFQLEELYNFDYIVIREKSNWTEPRPFLMDTEYNEFHLYTSQIFNYLIDSSQEFRSIKKIKIDNFNTTILIFEKVDLN